MSDDAPRSTHGNRPDQRRGRGAPPWWDALQRTDLPDDPQGTVVDTAGWELPEGFVRTRVRRGRLTTVLSIGAAVLVALVVALAVWLTTAAAGRSASMTAAVIVAVPVALLVASLLASVAGRRRRH